MADKKHCDCCDAVMTPHTDGYDMPIPGHADLTAKVSIAVSDHATDLRKDICQACMPQIIVAWAAKIQAAS